MNRLFSFQRFATAALAIAIAVPMSAYEEPRRLWQTDVTQLSTQQLDELLSRECSRGHASRQTTQRPAGAISDEAVLDFMNRERRAHGLGPLRLDSRLNDAAADRMRDMFAKGYFNHVSPDGVQPFTWVTYRDYRYSAVGENLAEGYRSAQAVVDGWMNSPGHRANILGSAYQDAGIAIYRGSPDGRTNGYTVVALYGRESSRRAGSLSARRR